jgi:hypothetical protein
MTKCFLQPHGALLCRHQQKLFAAILSHVGLSRGYMVATHRTEADQTEFVLPEWADQLDLVG